MMYRFNIKIGDGSKLEMSDATKLMESFHMLQIRSFGNVITGYNELFDKEVLAESRRISQVFSQHYKKTIRVRVYPAGFETELSSHLIQRERFLPVVTAEVD